MNPQFEAINGYAEADDDTVLEYRTDDDAFAEGDDDAFAEADDDSAEADDDSAEFIGGLLSRGIGGALNAVNRIVRPTIRTASRLNVPTPSLPSGITSGISAVSNLAGQLTSPTGKRFQFKLPGNTATKADIATLKRAVDANTKAIRVNSAAIKKEAEAIVSLRKDVREIDTKHIAATKEQNKIIGAINSRVGKLRKDLDKSKQDAQMQTMMSMLMPPKLKSVTFETQPGAGTATNVSESSFDSNNMLLMLALTGGFGGGSDSNNMLPLILMMKK